MEHVTKTDLAVFEKHLVTRVQAVISTSIENAIETIIARLKCDMELYLGTLTEEYQSRLKVVAEGVTGTWDKCERKYTELSEVDQSLSTRLERIESVLVMYDTSGKVKGGRIAGRKIRRHAGKGQRERVNQHHASLHQEELKGNSKGNIKE